MVPQRPADSVVLSLRRIHRSQHVAAGRRDCARAPEWSRHVDVRWQPARRGGIAVADDLRGPPDHATVPLRSRRARPRVLPGPPLPSRSAAMSFQRLVRWGAAIHRATTCSALRSTRPPQPRATMRRRPSSVMYPRYKGIVSGAGQPERRGDPSLYGPSGLSPGWSETTIGTAIGGARSSRTERSRSAPPDATCGTRPRLSLRVAPAPRRRDIIARVDSLEAVHRWSKAASDPRRRQPRRATRVPAGLRRQGLAFQSPGRGRPFDSTDGGAGPRLSVVAVAAREPVEAYAAVDGGTWRLIGAETIAMPADRWPDSR